MEPTLTEVMSEIKQLRIDVNIIKKSMPEIQEELTEEEHARLDRAIKSYEKGETITLDEIEVVRKNAGLEIQ